MSKGRIAAFRWTPVHAAVAAGGYGTTVYAIDPYKPRVIGCPWHAATGGYCPGCGSTRAMHELLHGNIGASLNAHPAVLPVAALMAVLWAAWVIRVIRPQLRTPTPTDVPWLASAALAVGLVVITVGRNALGWWIPPIVAS